MQPIQTCNFPVFHQFPTARFVTDCLPELDSKTSLCRMYSSPSFLFVYVPRTNSYKRKSPSPNAPYSVHPTSKPAQEKYTPHCSGTGLAIRTFLRVGVGTWCWYKYTHCVFPCIYPIVGTAIQGKSALFPITLNKRRASRLATFRECMHGLEKRSGVRVRYTRAS